MYIQFWLSDLNQLSAKTKAARASGSADLVELEKQLAQAQAKVSAFDTSVNRLKTMPYTTEFGASYNELFADLMAVVRAGDLTVMEAVGFGPARGEARNFAKPVDVKGWKEAGEHLQLTPVRGHLGTTLLRNVASFDAACKSQVVSFVVEQFGAQLEEEVARKTSVENPEDVEGKNIRLIQRLAAATPPDCTDTN